VACSARALAARRRARACEDLLLRGRRPALHLCCELLGALPVRRVLGHGLHDARRAAQALDDGLGEVRAANLRGSGGGGGGRRPGACVRAPPHAPRRAPYVGSPTLAPPSPLPPSSNAHLDLGLAALSHRAGRCPSCGCRPRSSRATRCRSAAGGGGAMGGGAQAGAAEAWRARTLAAVLECSMCMSICTAASSRPEGLAMSLPAMSGALHTRAGVGRGRCSHFSGAPTRLPWMASNMAIWSPMFVLAPRPTEPVTWGGDVREDCGGEGRTRCGCLPAPCSAAPPLRTVAIQVQRHHDVKALGLVLLSIAAPMSTMMRSRSYVGTPPRLPISSNTCGVCTTRGRRGLEPAAAASDALPQPRRRARP